MVAPLDRSVVCPVLVGRAAPVAALERLLERACAGRGTAALLVGEAGVGKSRLIAEAKDRARHRGMAILEGHCFESDRILPYAPLLDLLRAIPRDLPGEELAHALGPVRGGLADLLPELATPTPTPESVAPQPGAGADPEREKRRIFEALADCFLRLATLRPLLVVVEDLHWCDDTSLEFLFLLARRIESRPILLLLTYRDEESHAGLIGFLASVDRAHLAAEYRLPRLPLAEIEAMLRAIFAEWQAVPADLLYTLHTLTEGNPFFIEETLKALLAMGDLAPSDGTWARRPPGEWRVPRSVQDAVQRRALHLSPAARDVLTSAAVIGQRFDFGLLQAVAGVEEDDLVRRLKELVAAQLVVETRSDLFTFRHALTRQAIAAQLLGRERRRLHRTIVETLERRYADGRDGHAAELAYHAYEARDWVRAYKYARRAGEQAQALHALHEAIEQFTRALEAVGQLALPLPPAMLRARGQAYETLGDFDHARADYAAALDVAHAAGDEHAAWQALLDLGAFWAGHDYARAGEYLRQALERARTLADPDSLAQTLNRLGNWLANTGHPDEGLRLHREALHLFETIGHRPGIAATLDLVAMASVFAGDPVAAVGHLDRAVELYRALGDRSGLAACLAARGPFAASPALTETSYAAARPLVDCLRDADEGASLMRGLGWPAGVAFVGVGAIPTCTAFGDYGTALAWSGETLRIATEIGHRQWCTGAHSATGAIYTDLFMPEPAIEHQEIALALARDLGSAWWISFCTVALVQACFAKGDLARAEVALAASYPPGTAPLERPIGLADRRLAWARGELAFQRGAPTEALHIADTLLASAPGAPHSQPIPALLKLRGEALAGLGRFEAAEEALEGARQGATERGLRPLLWRVHRALGQVHERRKRPQQAGRAFAAAREIIATLAASIPDEDTREHYRAAALATLPPERPPTSLRAARQAHGGLTRREREVAALIAQGKSNREIAAALFMGEGTVATHVSSILGKLDFTSRAQVAAWVTERGLADPA
jgi:DNA-binding CsgD family transcriptional regulator